MLRKYVLLENTEIVRETTLRVLCFGLRIKYASSLEAPHHPLFAQHS